MNDENFDEETPFWFHILRKVLSIYNESNPAALSAGFFLVQPTNADMLFFV
jgi:hypothetical protein